MHGGRLVALRLEVDEREQSDGHCAQREPLELHAAEKQHGRSQQEHDEDAGKMAFQRDKAA